MAQKDKVQLIHPEGKKAPAISKKTYDIFSKAIINILAGGKTLTYTEIAEEVKKHLDEQKVLFDGSVEWFSVAVKQHLEAEGLIETTMEKGRKLHRLKDQ